MNPNLQGNYVDLIIVLLVGYFVWRSIHSRPLHVFADFLSFTLSLLLALSLYSKGGKLLVRYFSISSPVANALGFLFVAVLAETILGFFFEAVFQKVKLKLPKLFADLSKVVFGVLEALVLIAFVILLAIALPLRPAVKRDLSNSKIGGVLIERGARYENLLNRVFGEAVSETISYLTIEPNKDTRVVLQTEVVGLSIDKESESQMFTLINYERRQQGLTELTLREELVPVAREHARDMWNRKYFSHYSPEGEDVGDRLDKVDISYFFAGENLALAPTVQIAHTGLMNSEGHRANILNKDYKRVGVGVIDNGFYGKIFVQVFTD